MVSVHKNKFSPIRTYD
ncbi:unnamed protein product [Callosobruchus maculatus]|uniref:Uncharacterized protein n=1 Tax=Callosobruchus maculatus TaxID=64391 RepID=A0A653BGX3_CALMS|nr:unnamed protein product [Callosobruchus maculatus]